MIAKENIAAIKEPRRILANPTILTYAADFGTPVSVFHKLSIEANYGFLFESTEGDGRLARYSFLAIDPLLSVSFTESEAQIECNGKMERRSLRDPLKLLEELLEEHLGIRSPGSDENPDLSDLPFSGGFVGYMGYGANTYFEHIAMQEADPFEVPVGVYGLYDSVVVFDHQYRRVYFISYRGKEHAQSLVDKALSADVLEPLRLTSARLNDEQIYQSVSGPFTRQSFEDAVRQCKEYICEGQVFQIVLSQRFSTRSDADAIDIYRMLCATNPSPYAYFLKMPTFSYLGSSPETFVRCQNKQLLLRAIAGTRPRGRTSEEDELFTRELKESEKEMAEHRMLVDLGRNDLGRVCRPGTIKTGPLACLTRYTHVMHLFTEITGELEEGRSCFDAYRACFPAGTVSGAPKVRAMQLLSRLEPEQRGIYSGSVGYFDVSGNMDGAIAIRSMLVKDGCAHVNAGGGVVYDSDPTMEYEETRNKAKSLLQAVKLAGANRGAAQ